MEDKYNCYNVALKYLQGKYGVRRLSMTDKASDRIRRARNNKERKELLSQLTDADYDTTFNSIPIENFDDIEVELLMNQYNYGRTVRVELYYKLVRIGAIKE